MISKFAMKRLWSVAREAGTARLQFSQRVRVPFLSHSAREFASSSSSSSSSFAFSPAETIRRKRDGKELTSDEISSFVLNYHNGSTSVADYHMSAFLMSVYFKGMTNAETAALTRAMADSGTIAKYPSSEDILYADKHSTGGVGDKVSLLLAPLLASFDGVRVPMMSGRGLGHTGGTLDKLESIPGLTCSLSQSSFADQLENVGAVISAVTSDIAPVDAAMYALRDVTATTESLPLIGSSIMSKKIAENPDYLVLDVKTGSGAFLRDWEDTVELAKVMVAAGEGAGIPTVAIFTSMDQPLGRAVGNFNEVQEAAKIMAGEPPSAHRAEDVVEVTETLAAELLAMAGKASTLEEAREMARDNLASGKAFEAFRHMIIAQGGNFGVLDGSVEPPQAACVETVRAPHDGYVASIDSLEVGLACVALGGGRQSVHDTIDGAAGFHFHAKVGESFREGDALFDVRGASEALVARAAARVTDAMMLEQREASVPISLTPLVSHALDCSGLCEYHEWSGRR